MKRMLLVVTVLAALVAVPLAQAQDAEKKYEGEIVLGLMEKDVDTTSSKFEEYRDIPNGVTVPYLRLIGEKGELRYSFFGKNVRQDDQEFGARVDTLDWRFAASFNQIPHRFGNEGRSILTRTGPGKWELSDALQATHQATLEATNPRSRITYPFLFNLVTPSIRTGELVDLALERERSRLAFSYAPEEKVYGVSVTYTRERRTGDRAAAGTAFGFGNVVETPEPVHYLTQVFGLNGDVHGDWGAANAGFRYDSFENRIEFIEFDNPFRVTDSTDSGAYQAPGSSSIAGARFGRVSLPPDNEAFTGHAGVSFRLPAQTRVRASAQLGSWKQNDSPFIPYATNTAITTPVNATDPNALPALKLDGKADVTSFNVYVSSRPRPKIGLTARFRRYDFDNKTPRYTFPGYVRFDGYFQANGRITVPYGFTTDRFDATASYDFGKVTAEIGARHLKMDRTFRDTEETTEKGVTAGLNFRPTTWAVFRGTYERASRDFDHYDTEESEDASFVVHPPAPMNLLELRRPDQAKRDYDRARALLTLSPGDGDVAVTLAYALTRDDFTETVYGLQEARYDAISADVSYTPSDRWTVFALYTREKNKNLQGGRQSGGSLSTNPLDDWFSDVEDKVDTIGAGATFQIVPEKWALNLNAQYQKVDGNNDLESPAGGTPDLAFDIPVYDDTKLTTISGDVSYTPNSQWTFGAGAFWEEYDFEDQFSNGLLNYMPASFFLAANDGPYKATVGWLRVAYRF